MQNHNISSSPVLSDNTKPRLKWTMELHHKFVEAVNHLGGPEKATPKSLMRIMEIPGMTLFHLKSHLQKYRLGKSNIDDYKQEGVDFREVQSNNHCNFEDDDRDNESQSSTKDLQAAQALKLQIEVQMKLHQQIEVQRHLQLRIEAQGKYLQSVLKKAQETLSGYTSSSSSLDLEHTKSELSKLSREIGNTASSEVTEAEAECLSTKCSTDSSLTSSDSCVKLEDDVNRTRKLTHCDKICAMKRNSPRIEPPVRRKRLRLFGANVCDEPTLDLNNDG